LLSGSVPEASEDIIGMVFSRNEDENKGEDEFLSDDESMDSLSEDELFDLKRDYMKDLIELLDTSEIDWISKVDFIIGIY
jgi:hypothetical protein